jgi:hypothetical protein
VLWNGGISFGGVIAFLFADLLILPILNIYRKYYGWKVAALLAGLFYISMATAALAVEGIFAALHLIPAHRQLTVMQESIHWNYTSVLNIVFLLLSGLLLVRFLKTGGPAMLREMDGGAPDPNAAPHHCCAPEPVKAQVEEHCCHPAAVEPVTVIGGCCAPKETAAEASSCCHEAAEPVAPMHDCCVTEPAAEHGCCHDAAEPKADPAVHSH